MDKFRERTKKKMFESFFSTATGLISNSRSSKKMLLRKRIMCIYKPNDNFSPESGGSVNPSNAIDAIRTHGIIKLKK